MFICYGRGVSHCTKAGEPKAFKPLVVRHVRYEHYAPDNGRSDRSPELVASFSGTEIVQEVPLCPECAKGFPAPDARNSKKDPVVRTQIV